MTSFFKKPLGRERNKTLGDVPFSEKNERLVDDGDVHKRKHSVYRADEAESVSADRGQLANVNTL